MNTDAIHQANKTIIDRLMKEGSDLSKEAAEKITALRRRGKHWEQEAIVARRELMALRIENRRQRDLD